ncbi:hypothetical protein [Pseudanabaena sp. PCC 6802]|uniref:hypothetical protein n=1 Tax=Pseudanabaena sp. PCC 6802 TaxID=118173 RepID=UPI0003480D05|nr:hypothetical protein [Pseudanabaena sp. PCC 6802]
MKEGNAAMTNTNIESLWPEEDFGVPEITPPIVILRHQAYALGQKTRNVLEGAVVQQINPSGGSAYLEETFYIQAPLLGGYRYYLFHVNHKAFPIYPLNIYSDERQQKPIKVDDEEEFRGALRQIFASEKTKNVIQSLLAQSLSETAS